MTSERPNRRKTRNSQSKSLNFEKKRNKKKKQRKMRWVGKVGWLNIDFIHFHCSDDVWRLCCSGTPRRNERAHCYTVHARDRPMWHVEFMNYYEFYSVGYERNSNVDGHEAIGNHRYGHMFRSRYFDILVWACDAIVFRSWRWHYLWLTECKCTVQVRRRRWKTKQKQTKIDCQWIGDAHT